MRAAANEVASFVQAFDESGRARFIFSAHEFRQQAATDAPLMDETLLRPTDFSVVDCTSLFHEMEGMYVMATEAVCCANCSDGYRRR
jgi:hypothetical protein